MQDKNQIIKSYNKNLTKWGRITNCIGIFCGFLPVIVLGTVYGLHIDWAVFSVGFVSIAAAAGIGWFVDPISYVPVLGAPGTMMGFLSGNVNGVRLPAAVIAADVAGTKPGTPENDIISILGMCASVATSTIVLTICAIGGTALLNALPTAITSSFPYMLPCIFGAIFIQVALGQLKLIPISLGTAFILRLGIKYGLLPSGLSAFIVLIDVIVTIAAGVIFYKQKLKKKAAEAK